jgi:hypothetical protein
VLASTLSFAGAKQCFENSLLTPRPADSISDAVIKIKKPSDEAGWFVNFGGGDNHITS